MIRRVLLIGFILLCAVSVQAAETGLEFGPFGKVTLYQGSPHPSQVVLFVSGDGGWNLGVIDMARELASLDALVVGIDITHYLKSIRNVNTACSYPAADFEALSKYIQKKLNYPRYELPVLVGYSSGATLVYATLAQGPPNTFLGAISLGFCPDLPLSKPLCKGYGLEWQRGPKGKGFSFLPFNKRPLPWITLQGTIDQVCDAKATESYVQKVSGGEVVILPKVGHGFSVPQNWMPQFKDAYRNLISRNKTHEKTMITSMADLPLVEVEPQNTLSRSLAVIISGDGGWAGIDRDIADALSKHGVPVVGLNSLQYFWTRRTPEEAARALERILVHYTSYWKPERIILIGYSFGADVLPFMVNRLPDTIQNQSSLIVLLGLEEKIDFEFHLSNWLPDESGTDGMPVLPEVAKLRGRKILCLRGTDESASLCRRLDPGLAKTIVLQGGHHFGGNYEAIAQIILHELSSK
jgi:type IV secretory pathway VirJ component